MLTSELSEDPKEVSPRTVHRELKEMHLSKCKSTRKPLVSSANRKKRRLFAKEHKNWTVEDWKRVMWSDESRFTLFQNDGRVRVWRKPHEALDPACVSPTVQASGGSVMIWACFCWHGHGSATLFSNKMNLKCYLEVLRDHVDPSMDWYFPEGCNYSKRWPYSLLINLLLMRLLFWPLSVDREISSNVETVKKREDMSRRGIVGFF